MPANRFHLVTGVNNERRCRNRGFHVFSAHSPASLHRTAAPWARPRPVCFTQLLYQVRPRNCRLVVTPLLSGSGSPLGSMDSSWLSALAILAPRCTVPGRATYRRSRCATAHGGVSGADLPGLPEMRREPGLPFLRSKGELRRKDNPRAPRGRKARLLLGAKPVHRGAARAFIAHRAPFKPYFTFLLQCAGGLRRHRSIVSAGAEQAINRRVSRHRVGHTCTDLPAATASAFPFRNSPSWHYRQ
jgi:hypothetical protein